MGLRVPRPTKWVIQPMSVRNIFFFGWDGSLVSRFDPWCHVIRRLSRRSKGKNRAISNTACIDSCFGFSKKKDKRRAEHNAASSDRTWQKSKDGFLYTSLGHVPVGGRADHHVLSRSKASLERNDQHRTGLSSLKALIWLDDHVSRRGQRRFGAAGAEGGRVRR